MLGFSRLEVREVCGDPTFRESYSAKFEKVFRDFHIHKTYLEVERWLYDFGPNRFVRVLKFEDGELVGISMKKKYGGGSGGDRKVCQYLTGKVRTGDRSVYVRYRCGEPDIVEFKGEFSNKLESYPEYDLFLGKNVVDWSYFFGDDEPLSVLRFENGRLSHIYTRDPEE